MNKRIKLAIGIGLVVLLLAAMFATTALAQGPGGAWGGMMNGGNRQGYGPGMTLAPALRSGASAGVGGQGYGPGVSGCPLFGGATAPGNSQPVTFDQAVAAAQQYVQGYGNADLVVAHAMEFDNNTYVQVREKSTGNGAFELLVNRFTGYVTPEPGPNMMWNTKYSHMAGFGGMGRGMMGGWQNGSTGPLTVTAEQARTAAQQWLNANLPGVVLSDEETQFYGYYTLDTMKDGQMAGMLSVNGYTGQVWYHTWHGNFITEKDF